MADPTYTKTIGDRRTAWFSGPPISGDPLPTDGFKNFAILQDTEGNKIYHIIGEGAPDASYSGAPICSMYYDITNGDIYLNHDGADNWDKTTAT